jgi:hypothetical protein
MSSAPVNPDAELLLEHYGTAAAPHIDGSLRDHLIGTFNLLRSWGNDQDVCLAGLFHSIYGTEIYTRQSAPLGERDAIRSAIGDRAEALAYLFCACDRDHLMSNVGQADPFTIRDRFTGGQESLDRESLAALLEISLANDLEQMPADADLLSPRGLMWTKRWASRAAFLSVAARKALRERTLVKAR